MTPSEWKALDAQRLRLYRWAEQSIGFDGLVAVPDHPDGGITYQAKYRGELFKPDESLDDCRPLLAEVERRGLMCEFKDAAYPLFEADCPGFKLGEWEWWLVTLAPAQIVAAVERLMETNP